jgi:hypothetical protein
MIPASMAWHRVAAADRSPGALTPSGQLRSRPGRTAALPAEAAIAQPKPWLATSKPGSLWDWYTGNLPAPPPAASKTPWPAPSKPGPPEGQALHRQQAKTLAHSWEARAFAEGSTPMTRGVNTCQPIQLPARCTAKRFRPLRWPRQRDPLGIGPICSVGSTRPGAAVAPGQIVQTGGHGSGRQVAAPC